MKPTLILATLLLFNISSVSAQDEEVLKDLTSVQWRFSVKDFTTSIPEGSFRKGKHFFSVKKSYSGKALLSLIRKVEALYPNFEVKFSREERETRPEAKPFWAFGDFDNVKIARLITTRAIKYYADISPALPPRGAKKIDMLSTTFDYSATAIKKASFKFGKHFMKM